MNNRSVFLMAGLVAMGMCCPMAYAEDKTNEYFATPMSKSTVEVTTTSPVLIEKSTCVDKTVSAPVLIEKEISAPVMVEKTGVPPVMLEDRIVKQKHKFGIGIWPLFDFEVM